MTALARVDSEVASFRSTLSQARAFINEITDARQSSEAYKRLKLAREWARIRGVADAVTRDLLELEISCLRKIVEIGGISDLPRTMQAVAKWWYEKTDAQVTDLIERYGQGTSSAKTVKETADRDQSRYDRAAYVTSPEFLQNQSFEGDTPAYPEDYKSALADLVQHFYDDVCDDVLGERGSAGFEVAEIAERFMRDIGIGKGDDPEAWGQREGIFELCRRAILEAPSTMIGGSRAPAFITCVDRSPFKGKWVRVPFRVANLYQLHDMVKLRAEQADAARRSAEAIADLYDQMAAAAEEIDSQVLGDIAAHMALSDRDEATRAAS